MLEGNGSLKLEFNIERGDFAGAGDASRKIKKVLQSIGLNPGLIRKISIATYEAEMNLVIHSLGGKILVSVEKNNIIIAIEDKGPGIENVELAMTEGYSTASNEIREMGFGAGMGLPNIKRCSDRMDIHSELGSGTKIILYFNF